MISDEGKLIRYWEHVYELLHRDGILGKWTKDLSPEEIEKLIMETDEAVLREGVINYLIVKAKELKKR